MSEEIHIHGSKTYTAFRNHPPLVASTCCRQNSPRAEMPSIPSFKARLVSDALTPRVPAFRVYSTLSGINAYRAAGMWIPSRLVLPPFAGCFAGERSSIEPKAKVLSGHGRWIEVDAGAVAATLREYQHEYVGTVRERGSHICGVYFLEHEMRIR